MIKKSKKDSKLFDDLIEGLEAAIKLAQGKRIANTKVTSVTITPVRKRTPSQIRSLRLKLDMSQAVFANIMGVTNKAEEAWEAGTKSPSGPALRIFEILEKEARVIERVGIYSRKKSA